MSIVLGRVDYRLLHCIVATMWAPQSGAQRVMVIDDRTANDPIIKESMRLGKPAAMACSIITEETAIKNFKQDKIMITKCLSDVKIPTFSCVWKKKRDKRFPESLSESPEIVRRVRR